MSRSLVIRGATFVALTVLACSSGSGSLESLSSQTEPISGLPLPAPKRVFGQPDLKQTNYNEVVANRPFHPAGAFVDRAPSASTNSRVFVWDGGNNRVLGFDTIGNCVGGAKNGQACTEDSFCGTGSVCQINPTKNASFALGQTSTSGKGACNGDNTTSAPASASSLCLVPYPYQISPLEGPRGGQMARDTARNIYLVDTFNNRVLKYNTPFTSDKSADWQFGQPSFSARACNQGLEAPTARTLCTGALTEKPFAFFFTSAVDVSPDGQKIWVADPGNHRVLRVKPGVLDAELVLGQSDFTSAVDGCADPNGPHMCGPTGIAYDSASDTLYVLDGRVGTHQPEESTARILVFRNPATNGEAADEVWFPQEGTFAWARGLTLEPGTGALWVSDTGNERALRFVAGSVTHVIGDNDLTPEGCTGELYAVCQPHGSIGIDRDGKLLVSDVNSERVARFPGGAALGQAPVDAVGHMFDQPGRNGHRYINRVGPSGLSNPGYVAFVGSQLVVSDRLRIVFWNNYTASTPFSGGNASGVLAQEDFNSQEANEINKSHDFGPIGYDATRKKMYATHGDWISIWNVPTGLVNEAAPVEQIHWSNLLAVSGAPLECPEGCAFTSLFVDAANDIGWVTDGNSNRVMRITSLSTSARRIDLVLGQDSLSQGICNRGGGIAVGHEPEKVAPNGFCAPTQAVLDAQGNLFVVDGTWECSDGNCRVVEFAKGNLPAPSSALKFANILPLRVFGPDRLNTRSCDPSSGRLCSPRWLAFDPRDGAMVATGDAYYNPLDKRLAVWTNPVKPQLSSPVPTAFFNLNVNQAGAVAFDSSGRLAVLDHTWNRVVLYNPTTACNPATEDCKSENPPCTSNAQCDDGVFCNGSEVCSAGACRIGTNGSALCYNPIPLARFENSLNFNTFGERWYVVTELPNGWQASNVGNRVIRVNGQVMTPGQMPLPAPIDGDKWYFHFGPGTLPETQFTNWSFW
jgi:DNA-binding beta-propeller fold protein YncE